MRFVKFSFLICLVSLCGAGISLAQRPDTDVQARARALLREKMAEMPTNAPAAMETPAPAPSSMTPAAAAMTPAKAVSAPAMETPAPVMSTGEMVPKGSETDLMLREKMRQSIAESKAHDAMAQPAPAPAKPSYWMFWKKSPATVAVAAPAPVYYPPDSKEGKLAALLELYKADKVTPEEYHQRRAEIMGMP